MTEINLISAFLIGIAGSVHCIGMCGGIAGAFTFAIPKNASVLPYIYSYNIGRILSYTAAGAVTGYLGSIFSSSLVLGLAILQSLSIVFLVLMALYISDIFKALSVLERAGNHLWKRIQPLSKKLIPFKSPVHAVYYGMIWGWLPCGLVYSALTWSLAANSALNGALFMLAFGAGTLPALIATSLGANSLIPLMQKKIVRISMAALLFIFAISLTFNLLQGIK